MGITSKRGGRERSERGRGRRKKGRGGRGRRSASKLNDNSYEKPEWQIINTNTKKNKRNFTLKYTNAKKKLKLKIK